MRFSDRAVPPTPAPAIPGEPGSAEVQTLIPGPASEALRARHGRWQDARSVHFYTDARQSLGNYIVDVDGNTMLDLYGHIACLPLGYNHPALLEAWRGGRFDWAAGWRPALGVSPPPEWVELVEGPLARLAPPGMGGLLTVTSGAEAVENAIKLACIAFLRRQRGGPPTAADQAESMVNGQIAANRLKILSFEGAFHGRSLGALSATRSKAIHKVDFPAFDWPVVPFPANRFPAEAADQAAADAANAALEAECLARVEAEFRAHPDRIAAILVEPIQGEGGDRHASAAFFHGLQRIAKANGALFIVDEVQTGGGGCGIWWEHTRWELPEPPDIVTFSKKMQIGGCWFRPEHMPEEPYRIFNTFLGDPLRAAQLAVIAEVIERDHLLENTRITGELLMAGLREIGAWTVTAGRPLLTEVRGRGTWCAFDLPDGATRDRFVQAARQRGLEMGGSGSRSVRFRPALILAPRHVLECLDRIGSALAQI